MLHNVAVRSNIPFTSLENGRHIHLLLTWTNEHRGKKRTAVYNQKRPFPKDADKRQWLR